MPFVIWQIIFFLKKYLFLDKRDTEEIEYYYHAKIVGGELQFGGEELERNNYDNYYEVRFVDINKLNEIEFSAKENKIQESNDKKAPIKKIIKIVLIIVVGIIIIIALPFIYLILEILYSMFIDVPSVPKEKHGEFPFELVYEYKGEQITIKDTIVCDYEGISWSLDGGNSRDWNCEFSKDDEYGQYYIDVENEPTLFIDVPYAGDYYMGDKNYKAEDARPLIMYQDEATSTNYMEPDKVDVVNIKIINNCGGEIIVLPLRLFNQFVETKDFLRSEEDCS
mgnify:CR=1 FL=1